MAWGHIVLYQMVDGNFHQGGFSASAYSGDGYDFFTVDGQPDVPLNDVERDFFLFEGNQRFYDFFFHGVFPLF